MVKCNNAKLNKTKANKLYFLGISGTFMASLATIAKQMGYDVTGSDTHAYPPMSTHLANQGIDILPGYDVSHLDSKPDLVIIGNAISRGNPELEYVLDHKLPYISGPQWLSDHVLQGRTVLVVTGTHGKTTTTSMLSWILDSAGLNPSFLIGGIAENFQTSSRLTDSPYFVIEGDEYDTAFFDKRSKFVHYHPQIAIMNNLEFDHADIFPNLEAIERQFHHLVRMMPQSGKLIVNADVPAIGAVLAKGCWTPVERFGVTAGDWRFTLTAMDGSAFTVYYQNEAVASVEWNLYGEFNVMNAVAAMAAAYQVGVEPAVTAKALTEFKGVTKRLQVIADDDVTILSDFSHHPTAIAAIIQAVKARYKSRRTIAVVEPRSNTMKMGVHAKELAEVLQQVDQAFVYHSQGMQWDLRDYNQSIHMVDDTEKLISQIKQHAQANDVIVVMSNGDFDNVPQRLAQAFARGG